MKPHFLLTTLFFGLFLSMLGAQAPNKFNYQAVAKNSSGAAVTGAIEVEFTILDGAAEVYKEMHNANADNNGLFNLQIGAGTPLSGSWAAINWGVGAGKSLKVRIKPAGGSYIDMGTQELVSVPYAQHATGLKLPFAADLDAGGNTAFSVVNHNGNSIAGVSYGNGDGILGQYQGTGLNAGVSGVTYSPDANSQAVWAGNPVFGTGASLANGPFSGTFWGGPVRIQQTDNAPNLYIGNNAILWDVNVPNVLGVRGQENPDEGGIQLGTQASIYGNQNGYVDVNANETHIGGAFLHKTWNNSTEAILVLGDPSHLVKATFGLGLTLSTYNHADGLWLSETGETFYKATAHYFNNGPLYANGISTSFDAYNYFTGPGVPPIMPPPLNQGLFIGETAFSIKAVGPVRASEFQATSDARIKNILHHSDSRSDLATLLRLKVTDYTHKDWVNKGTASKKGFIAQEVEEVFPEAISLGKDFIPDIYAPATRVQCDQTAQTLTISLGKPCELKAGDRVRIIADKEYDLEVAVAADNSFTVKGWQEGETDRVFVYGSEVEDFRTVDYDRIFTLNVSATQALAQEVEVLKAENAGLKVENAQLRLLFASLETRLNELSAQVQAKQDGLSTSSR